MSVTLPDCANQEGKGMSHGVQGDGVQAVAVFRSQIELSDGGLETGGYFFKRRLLARLLEDGFRRLARIRLEHPDHILRHADEYPLSSLLNDIEAAGIAVHLLPAQFKNFRGTKAGSQGEQGISCNCGCRFSRSSRSALTSSLVRKRNLHCQPLPFSKCRPWWTRG